MILPHRAGCNLRESRLLAGNHSQSDLDLLLFYLLRLYHLSFRAYFLVYFHSQLENQRIRAFRQSPENLRELNWPNPWFRNMSPIITLFVLVPL